MCHVTRAGNRTRENRPFLEKVFYERTEGGCQLPDESESESSAVFCEFAFHWQASDV